MKYLIVTALALFLLTAATLHAREIHLHFPHFSGQAYDWQIFQGEKALTVRTGEISPDGRVTLVMPDVFQDYCGMTRWLLKNGGGLDMIYTGKGFSVECLSAQPGPDNIKYKGNPENDYLKSQHERQQIILDKLGALDHLLQVYAPDEALHKTALDEQALLRRAFEQTQAARAKSPLYAARFAEIVDFTRGIADRIYDDPEDHTVYFNDFVTNTLDFKDLYTSGHWDQVLYHWLMMNIRSTQGDPEIEHRLETALGRMEKVEILSAFAEKAVPLLVQQGKDDFLPILQTFLNSRPGALAALSSHVKLLMASVKILTGKKAPDLVFHAPVRTWQGKSEQDIVLETGNLEADHTIFLFYQGECPLCEDVLTGLANKYVWLAEHNVRVIAVSGDKTELGFEKTLAYHQWTDNYCDFTGMNGKNFLNYGVQGVPTLFLVDRKGIVQKKTAMVEELITMINR